MSGFADYGRKRAALLGQFLITLSTVLFAVAMFLPTGLAIPTYIVAQGLQGMSGIGILDQSLDLYPKCSMRYGFRAVSKVELGPNRSKYAGFRSS